MRARIVAGGIKLFSRHGIEAATVDQIAEAADIGKGTIYNYFQAKEDIVVAFLVDLEQEVQKKLRRVTQSKRSLDSILASFVRLQFRLKRPHHRFVRVFMSQMFLRTEQFLPYMVEIQKVMDPTLEAFFGSLQKRGAIRADVKLPEVIGVFKTVQLGLTALWAVEGPPFKETERTLKLEMKLFSEGLRAAGS